MWGWGWGNLTNELNKNLDAWLRKQLLLISNHTVVSGAVGHGRGYACTHAHAHVCGHRHTHTRTHAHTRARTCAHTQVRARTRTHARAHTQAHTGIQSDEAQMIGLGGDGQGGCTSVGLSACVAVRTAVLN